MAVTTLARKLIVELVGTFALVYVAVGAAVTGIQSSGPLSVALAFGLVLAFGVYAFGPVSGCHVNPAVTLGMVTARKMPLNEAGGYWAAQLVGGVLGGFMLWLSVNAFDVKDQTGALGTNSYGTNINMAGAFVVETILTLVFVLVVLLVTDKAANAGMAGVAIGAALAAVHLVGIPLTGTSVNPARSIGPALFEGGTALTQLWLFILAPLVGGLLAALLYRVARSADH